MARVVVFTTDVVGQRMAGPGIRAWNFARELSRHFPTTLVANFVDAASFCDEVPSARADSADARAILRNAAVLVAQPSRRSLAIAVRGKRVWDLYDPLVVELRELYGNRTTFRESIHEMMEWRRLRRVLATGDLFVVAHEWQREFYAKVASDASSFHERSIEIPFGVDNDPPPDEVADLGTSDPAICWGGGVWPWLDPETAIRAVVRLRERGLACRILFLGLRRPETHESVARRSTLESAIAEAGDAVICKMDWTPYNERARWLKACRAAIMLDHAGPEADLAIRTRLFDAIWCGLPVVATRSGYAGDLVDREQIGVTVGPGNVEEVAGGIEKLIRDDVLFRRSVLNLERLQQTFRWSEVTAPLVKSIHNWL